MEEVHKYLTSLSSEDKSARTEEEKISPSAKRSKIVLCVGKAISLTTTLQQVKQDKSLKIKIHKSVEQSPR